MGKHTSFIAWITVALTLILRLRSLDARRGVKRMKHAAGNIVRMLSSKDTINADQYEEVKLARIHLPVKSNPPRQFDCTPGPNEWSLHTFMMSKNFRFQV